MPTGAKPQIADARFLMNTHTASMALGVSYPTTRWYIKRGLLDSTRTATRQVLLDIRQVLALKQQRDQTKRTGVGRLTINQALAAAIRQAS